MRLSIYKSASLVKFEGRGSLILENADNSAYVYILLRGAVDSILYKHDIDMDVVTATYQAGQVFGDASIQKLHYDALKCLSKDVNRVVCSSQEVYCLRIPKEDYISAMFHTMKAELLYKILLLQSSPYFKELSPYSLTTLAQICEVQEFKYGDVVYEQHQTPDVCYVVGSGCLESVYQYSEQASTADSLKTKLFKTGLTDYRTLALQQARPEQKANAEKPKDVYAQYQE